MHTKAVFSTEYKHPNETDCISGRLLKLLGRLLNYWLHSWSLESSSLPSNPPYLPALGLATQLLVTCFFITETGILVAPVPQSCSQGLNEMRHTDQPERSREHSWHQQALAVLSLSLSSRFRDWGECYATKAGLQTHFYSLSWEPSQSKVWWN